MPTQPYIIEGRRVPGVTTLLRWSGHEFKGARFMGADQRERVLREGTYFHEMTMMELRGELDLFAVPDWARPRLDAWLRFREGLHFEPTMALCEEPVLSPTYRYGGTPDLVGLLHGRDPAVIDEKRGAVQVTTALQTMGYALALSEPVYRRFGFELGADGKPHMVEYPVKDWAIDRAAFLGCVTNAHWMLERGLVRFDDEAPATSTKET